MQNLTNRDPRSGVHGPQGSTGGFLGIHDIYMYEMKAKYRNAQLCTVLV